MDTTCTFPHKILNILRPILLGSQVYFNAIKVRTQIHDNKHLFDQVTSDTSPSYNHNTNKQQLQLIPSTICDQICKNLPSSYTQETHEIIKGIYYTKVEVQLQIINAVYKLGIPLIPRIIAEIHFVGVILIALQWSFQCVINIFL